MSNRINYLDGVRGLAILLVILFHTYAAYKVMPYGTQFFEIWIFKYGWVGVELFFLLSGFVILMTLERCGNLVEFLMRRWIRLFPAMLLACMFIYVISGFFPNWHGGKPELVSLLPSLTFSNPIIWEKILQQPVNSLEATFWSLYVEVSFYFIIGCIYFKFLKRDSLKTIFSVACLYTISVFIRAIIFFFDTKSNFVLLLGQISSILGLNYFGWFAAGALLYTIFHKSQTRKGYLNNGVAVIFLMLCSSVSTGYANRQTLDAILAVFVITSLFPVVLLSKNMQKFLSMKIWIFLGFISYPLYLIHDRTLISSTIWLAQLYPNIPSYFLPIIPIFTLIVISWLMARYWENSVRNFLYRYVVQKVKF